MKSYYKSLGLTEDEFRRLAGVIRSARCRCTNPNHRGYRNYGARGIKVCAEWLPAYTGTESFVRWAVANGYRPGLAIDRIDNSRGYSPDNCRWVSPKVNQNNRRTCRYVRYGGRTISVGTLSELTGIKYSTLLMRVRRGDSVERAIRATRSYEVSDPAKVARMRSRNAKLKWEEGGYDNRRFPQN